MSPPSDRGPEGGPGRGPAGGAEPAAAWIDIAGERRRVTVADFPLSLGGPGTDVPFPGRPPSGEAGEAIAWLGRADGELFVQPAEGVPPDATITCNGRTLAASQWLEPGDLLEAGDGRLRLLAAGEGGESGPVLRMEARRRAAPPRLDLPAAPPPARPPAGAAADPDPEIRPVDFTPARLAARRRRRGPGWRAALVAAFLLLLAAAAWAVFTARSVQVVVEPAPDEMAIEGALLHLELGGRHLLRPGRYLLTARKAGYRPLEVPLEVGDAPSQVATFELEKLPGTLAVTTVPPVEGAEVLVDGDPVGATPLAPLELAAGEHRVTVRADGWLEAGRAVEIEGAGVAQSLELALSRDGAPVTLRSDPPGARVRLDGEPLGTTPLTQGVPSGRHTVELTLPGYRAARLQLQVAPGQPLEPPVVELVPADGLLAVASDPPGAAVTVDGAFRGETPLELPLPPGEHTVRLVLAGHEPAELEVALEAEERRSETVALEPIRGEVEVLATPASAEVLVDGEPAGRAGDTFRLLAVPHEITVRAEGHLAFTTTVTPQPGATRTVEAALQTPEEQAAAEAAAAAPPPAETAADHRLVLLPPGRLKLGAPRREPGRRSNEVEYEAAITRPFYLGATEVTNRQFRAFRPGHRSGAVDGANLEIDHHPVVRVSWQDAAAYCNWLSEKEGLPPAYVPGPGGLAPADPMTTGYRLPTEAEWAWAARYHGGARPTPLRYPWGDAPPPPPSSGNYGDTAARPILGSALPGYTDGHPATAPSDAFPPTPPGLHSLGGNVSEWIHDRYGIPSPSAVLEDPTGPNTGNYHVIRGASWMDTLITELRLSYRDYGDEGRPDVGFRIARTPE